MSEQAWWLISRADASQIRTALMRAETAQDERCAQTGCMCDLREELCSKQYTSALHTLDSGLNQTDAVPADWRTPAGQEARG